MKLPRDLSGADLVKALERHSYGVTRQKGSHMRLTTHKNGEHHVTVPRHNPLRIGTLRAILEMVATHLGLDREELQRDLFD